MQKKQKLVLILAAIVILVVVGLFYYLIRTGKIKPLAAAEPTISLLPSSGMYEVGKTFGVNIIFNAAGRNIDGVDVHYLNYDPQVLEVQDADSGTAGVQIQPGALFSSYMGNNVDTASGKISLSGIVGGGGTPFTGSGTFASVTFKVLAATTATLRFDFTPGLTTDTNAVESGTAQDILGAANGGSYTLQVSSGASPTLTPTATITSGEGIRLSPTPACGGPKQPTCPPTTPATAQPTPELGESQTPAEIVVGPTATPTEAVLVSPSPGLTMSPTPTLTGLISPEITPTASPISKLAGFVISKTWALILYIGTPVVIVLALFFIWRWQKRRKEIISETTGEAKGKDEFDEDEMI